MKIITTLLAVAFVLASTSTSQTKAQTRTQLTFRADGTFRVLQVADMHYSNGQLAPCNDVPVSQPCSDLNTTDFIARVLDAEQPDLVVFTGDNIEHTRSAEEAILAFTEPVIDRQIPWAAVFGNHDAEADLSRKEMMDIFVSLPYSLCEHGPTDLFGVGNYIIQLMDNSGNDNLVNLYFIDSGDYSSYNGIDGYAWIHKNQIAWYMDQARTIRSENGDEIVPAMAFYHIPIFEYNDASGKVGDQFEGVYSANINSGLFSAFVEAADVRVATVGHDHINDYCGEHFGITLCYGGGVGYGTYGKLGWERRVRMFEFRTNGESLHTWKRLDNADLQKIDEQQLYSG